MWSVQKVPPIYILFEVILLFWKRINPLFPWIGACDMAF